MRCHKCGCEMIETRLDWGCPFCGQHYPEERIRISPWITDSDYDAYRRYAKKESKYFKKLGENL